MAAYIFAIFNVPVPWCPWRVYILWCHFPLSQGPPLIFLIVCRSAVTNFFFCIYKNVFISYLFLKNILMCIKSRMTGFLSILQRFFSHCILTFIVSDDKCTIIHFVCVCVCAHTYTHFLTLQCYNIFQVYFVYFLSQFLQGSFYWRTVLEIKI